MSRRPPRGGTPQRTARLIGGPAHGHTCPIPAKQSHLGVTLISGPAEVLDLSDPITATELLTRACGHWHSYEEIKGLNPDTQGLIPFRYARELPEPLEQFLNTLHRAHTPREDTHAANWKTIETLLAETGLSAQIAHRPGI